MNYFNDTKQVRPSFFVLAAIAILFHADVRQSMAQGRLAGVRNAVRNKESKKSSESGDSKTKSKRPSSSEKKKAVNNNAQSKTKGNSGRSDRHTHHERRETHHGSTVSFFAHHCPPPVVHTREIVHVYEPVLVPPLQQLEIVGQPVIEPVYEQAFSSETQQYDPAFELTAFEQGFETWSSRVSVWYGAGMDDISQGNLSALFQEPGGWGLDVQARTIREKGFSDHLWMGDLNLVYEPTITEFFRLRVGAGLNWLADSFGSDGGFNLTAGFDSRLFPRTNLAGEVDFGNLGDSDYVHAQLSVGYQVGNSELLAGFDYTNIGDVEMSSPFVGLRFRF